MGQRQDITGQRFGKLVALYELPEKRNGRWYWHCKCDCGNEKDIMKTSLTSGQTKSCGCLWMESIKKSNTANLLGQKFGRLTVIERVNGKWKCQCDCGGITYTTTTKLKTGHTQSCGCLQKERTSEASLIDITGQKFGQLTVLCRDLKYKKQTRWICQCECGNIISVSKTNLCHGQISCGCCNKSRGEIKIHNILQENNIPFIEEYKFSDCINPETKIQLRFDFFVNNTYLIEYDGKQHTIDYDKNIGWGEPLEKIHQRDIIKNTYCKEHNIPLIRIPYTHYNDLCIEDLLLETSNYII